MPRQRKETPEPKLSALQKRFAEIKAATPPPAWTPDASILLCPNIPSPLHGVNPRTIYGDKWWDKVRKEAYASTGFRCLACSVHKYQAKSLKQLEGHEVYIIDYQEGTATYQRTVPLCHYCHCYIHDGRLRWMLQSGKLPFHKYRAIINHGDKLLAEANLVKLTYAEREAELARLIQLGQIAEWSSWRLILDGKEYPTPFKNQDDYIEKMKGHIHNDGG